MPDTAGLAAFLIAVVTLTAMPGPAVLYIVARGVHQGRAAALVSALGVEVGSLAHVLAATLGISALIVSSEHAIAIVSYTGALYLAYLGLSTFLACDPAGGIATYETRPLRRIFRQGVVVELLNPKTALFMFAFLPRFADAEQGAVAWPMLALGALFVVVAICVDGIYGLLAGSLGEQLAGNARVAAVQRRVTGCVYIGLAAMTGLTAAGL